MRKSDYLRRDNRGRRPLMCLADAADFMPMPAHEFCEMAGIQGRGFDRKIWEQEYVVDCLERLGCLQPDKHGIGLGVGRESLMFYFARRCGSIVATDLYSADTQWSTAACSSPQEILKAAPFEYPRERLEVLNADMRELPGGDASYDFAWSVSSIEHVPTLRDLHKVFAELARVIKPGGYAVLTTEYCLTPPPYLLRSLNALDPNLVECMVTKLGAFEVVGEIDLDYNWLLPANAVSPRRFCSIRTEPQLTGYALSAMGAGNYVGISAIAPIAFCLRRTEHCLRSWEELPLPNLYRDFTRGVEHLDAQQFKEAAKAFDDALASGGTAVPLQIELMTRAYRLVAHCHIQGCSRDQLRAELQTLLERFPQGALQDVDVIQIIVKLAGDLLGKSAALELLRRAALSPSTLPDTSLILSLERLLISEPGADAELEFLRSNAADLLAHGHEQELIRRTAANHLKRRLPPGHDIAALVQTLLPCEENSRCSGSTN